VWRPDSAHGPDILVIVGRARAGRLAAILTERARSMHARDERERWGDASAASTNGHRVLQHLSFRHNWPAPLRQWSSVTTGDWTKAPLPSWNRFRSWRIAGPRAVSGWRGLYGRAAGTRGTGTLLLMVGFRKSA